MIGNLHLAGENKKSPNGRARPPQENGRAAVESPRILIIEDVLVVAWELESMLGMFGFEVCGLAAKGEDAVALASKLQPNLLLVDVNLGQGIDGVEAAQHICATRDVAVVFVTAYASAAIRERIEGAFPDAPIVSKPVIQERLRAAIQDCWQQTP